MPEGTAASLLAGSEMFGPLTRDQREALAGRCQVRRYPAGRRIFARGDDGESMYLIGSGSVGLSITSRDGGEVVLAILRPPRTFGEMALIDTGPRVATAAAREPTTLIVIPRGAVMDLLDEAPALVRALLTSLTGLIRQIDDRLADLVLLDLPGRVAKFLDIAAGSQNGAALGREDSSVPVDLRINQTDLARLVGGSRQQVNRILMDMERRGAIVRSGTRIVCIRRALLPLA
jgi:CRP/FNR family cyclic AMP-dependent transcriptional regulator